MPRIFAILLVPLTSCATDPDHLTVVARRYADAVCSGYVACDCQSQGGEYQDEAACVAQKTDDILRAFRYAREHELSYDSDCMDKRIAEIESLGCGVLTLNSEKFNHQGACHVFGGELSFGHACTRVPGGFGSNCEFGHDCVEECTFSYEDFVGAGESCNIETLLCDSYLECYDGVCRASPKLGEPCLGVPWSCGEGLYCEEDSLLCVPSLAAGDTCGAFQCAAGLHCDPDDETCRPKPPRVCWDARPDGWGSDRRHTN